MIKSFNWKFPLLLLIVVGVYYIYITKFSNPRTPLTIVADSVVFKRGCNNAESACLKLNFSFPAFSERISSNLSESIYSDYLLMIEDSSEVSQVEAFKNKLLDISYRYDSSFVDFSSSFPNSSNIEWFVKINFEVMRNDGKILTLRYFYADYMGGAHGIQNYHYQNYDVRKSKRIELTDVFENVKDFYAVAESAFNAKYLDGKGESSVNFGFPNDKFTLPREFGFGDKGLLLHYNVYEIASYVQGDILLEIPYSSVKEILKPKWKYLVE